MSTQHQVMMESSLAQLGRLELTPSSPTTTAAATTTTTAVVGVSLGPLLSSGGGPPSSPANEKNGQPPPPRPPASHLNGCVPLSHQVAGHKFGVDTVGILQHPDGTVLKQLQPPPRGPRELQFYNMVYAEDCCDPCLLELQNHLPKYYGTWSSPDSPKDLYLKLEDVTHRFIKPCIMDVKLGQKSYDPFASQEKRTDQIRKYPLMEEIGFLVLGMRVYNVCSDSFDSYDQYYGRGLVKETIKDGLSKFFHNGAGLRKDAVSASIRRVRHILRWFESQRQLVFYASSLLFVYEGFASSSSPISSSSTSPSSSSPPSSLASTPLISPPTEKPASPRTGDDGKGRRGHAAGREEDADVTEYNNNNIRVAVPLDYSLATMYANHRRGGQHHHYCNKGQFHGNGDSAGKTLGPATNVTTPSGEEDNSPWKHMAGRRPHPNGNGIRSQLESEEEEEEEQEGRRQGEGETERRATRSDTSKQKRDGGNGGEEEEVEVRMIDFAHVFSSDSHDQGYIYGLKHLLSVLEQILHESS